MGRDIKFIILNSQEQYGMELRSMLLQFDGVKIVAEVEDPALLGPAVSQFPVDVLLVNLDPYPEVVLPLVADVASDNKNLAIFAASESSDGPLILKAMRMGIKEFFPKPVEVSSLAEAIDKVMGQQVQTGPQGKLITVIGTSGGVGATMLTANLAAELAAIASGKVVVVDLDYRFGQVATLLDLSPTYTLSDLCGSPEALEPTVIERALMPHACGVHVLARPTNVTEAELITAAACTGVMTQLLQLNQFVVTDGPTRFDIGGSSLLSISDLNLMVVQLLVPCVRNAARILEGMRANGYNLDRTKLICNRVGREAGHLTVEQVAETLGMEVIAAIPDDWQNVSAAINLGEPLVSYSPKSKVRLAIQEIAERLHKPEPVSEDKDVRKKGLIGRIFANT